MTAGVTMNRLFAWLGAAAVATTCAALAPAADAATYTTSGLRCTKVGTARADRLLGTSRSDVICGLGGNDVIYGGSGNDVVDGGSGDDVVHGGVGEDRVYGGYGRDSMYGEDGADAMDGQADADTVSGGTGNDAIGGSTGADRIDGGTGDDRLSGGAGDDVIAGSTGTDVLSGGADDDTMTGSSGGDRLLGGDGDDDLSGGDGIDVIDGGAGTNWCDVASDDHQTACTVDEEAPVVGEVRVVQKTVDVTRASASVTVDVHVTDDSGGRTVRVVPTTRGTLDSARAGNGPRISGTPRDGWWRATLTVARYLPGGVVDLDISATDRVGRTTESGLEGAFTIVDAHPDLEHPVLRGLSVDRTSVDVRSASADVVVSLHVTDDASGVDDAAVCPVAYGADGWQRTESGCWETGRSSGTPQDGRWEVPLTVPRRSLSSAWGFQACFTDRAHPSGWDCWITPEEAEYDTAHGIVDQRPQVPGRPSRLQVIGLDADLNAPVLSSLTATPTAVDASHGARTVTVDVAATDVEGIREVYTRVVGEQTGLRLDPGFLGQLVSGTDQDGVWRFQFDVPGGMPPDRYHVEVRILDNTHYEAWSPAQDVEAGTKVHAFTLEQLASGGIITVG